MGKKSEKYRRIDPELTKEITAFAIECYKAEEDRSIRARRDRKRANTKMLLRNYRSLIVHCESAIFDAAHIDDDISLADILEMMSESGRDSFRVESIRESAGRTRIIIGHVNEMLELYRLFCERSPRIEDSRRYRIIYAAYIADETKTPHEIAEDEHIDRSTVYRDIDAATERLAALIFGVDGLYLHRK